MLPSLLQDQQDFLQLGDHLADELFVLGDVVLGLVAGEALARPADGEALVVEERADLADHQHVLALIIAAISAALHRVELRELLLPVAQHVGLDRAQVADFADGEVALAGNRWQLVVMTWFQHMPQPWPSVSALDER